MLFTTTAHPTALADAGTSYSHIAVNIGNNFIELEMNNAVEIIFPLIYQSMTRLKVCVTFDIPRATSHPIEPTCEDQPFRRHTIQGKRNIARSMGFQPVVV